MSAIQWGTVRDAIQQWFVLGSGLAGDHVVWAGQVDANGKPLPRPAGLYISLRLAVLAMPGFSDTCRYVLDTNTNTLTDNIEGPRVLSLTATCFQGTGGELPASSWALSVLNDALTASGRDDVFDILVAAGVGVGTYGDITEVGGQLNTIYLEPRATAVVKLNVASVVTFVYPVGQGWIETVHADGNAGTDVATVHVNTHR